MEEKDVNEKNILTSPLPENSPLNIDIADQEKSNKECKLEGSKFNEKLQIEATDLIPRLTKICTLLAVFTLFELLGGVYSGSIAILTISCQLFTDFLKTLISMISLYIIEKPANEEKTYGYHRSEVIGSISSFLIIYVLTIWLILNSIKEFFSPTYIDGASMILFSLCGLVINVYMRYLQVFNPVPDANDGTFLNNFKNDAELNTPLLEDYLGDANKDNIAENLIEKKQEKMEHIKNIHLLCDIFQSTFIIFSSVIIYYFEDKHFWVRIFDSFCAWSFGFIILIITVPITKDCIDILMEGAPKDIDIKKLNEELKNVVGVINVHDLHIWCVSFDRPSISLHILSDSPQKSLEGAMKVCKKFGIRHSTIQVEDNTQARRLSFVKCEHESDNGIH